jgi:type II secretory pathway component PulF
MLLSGAMLYGLYLVFIASRRRAAQRVLGLLADTVRLDLPLLPVVRSAAEDANCWEASILRRLAEGLADGLPLDQALRRASNQFPPLVVSQIAEGLRCGQPARALDHAVRSQTARVARQLHVVVPFLYVTLLMVAALSVSNMMQLYLWPHFAGMLADFNCPVPGVFYLARQLRILAAWLVILAALGGFVATILLLTGHHASGRGRPFADVADTVRWMLPGWRKSEWLTGLAAGARQMSLALSAGATAEEAIGQAARLELNVALRRRFDRALDLHRAGQRSLADSFRAARFPRHFLWTVETAEAAGNLPEALEDLARRYEADYSRLQMLLWNAFQSAAVILVGCYIGLHGFAFFRLWELLVRAVM